MSKTENDILAASLIIEGKKIKEIKGENYNKIYQTQTENSRELFPRLSSHWQNSLWIGGSGDQPINGILYGSRNVKVVDINPLAIHYILLRVAALEALNQEEFLSFFTLEKRENTNLKLSFVKIEPYLQENHTNFEQDPVLFWKTLINNYTKQEIFENLFYDDSTEIQGNYQKQTMLTKNPYLDKKFYYYLKNAIKRAHIQVYNQDIKEIHKICEPATLDKIYLSNVFLEMNFTLEEYQSFLDNEIYPLLSPEGEAMTAYFNISQFQEATLNRLGTANQIITYLKQHGCRPELILEGNKQISTAWIYQKKR